MQHPYQKPRILQVLPALHGGGVERGTIDISHALANAHYDSFVVSSGGKMVEQLHPRTTHIQLSVESKNPFRIFCNAFLLAKLIQTYGIDIIHARSRAPAWSAYIAARMTGRPFLTTFHSTYKTTPYPKRWYNAIMQKGEAVIVASHFIYDHVQHYYHTNPERIHLIPRGVDLEQFNPKAISERAIKTIQNTHTIPHTTPLILVPGRITHRKGFHIAIEALQRIQHLPWHTIFLGDPKKDSSYFQHLNTLIQQYRLQKRVSFIPYTQHIATYLAMADIVAIPSIIPEAFGRTCVESQAMGKPPIATNIGGHCDTVRHGETGWLIPPEKPDLLAEAITHQLHISSEQKHSMAISSREHVMKKFSLEQMCGKTLSLYDAIAEQYGQKT